MKKQLAFFVTLFFTILSFSFPSYIEATTGCSSTGSGGRCQSVATAFGPISTDIGSLVGNALTIILGFTGGVAVLLIIAAGYQLVMSQGNPEKVKEGRERLISAIVGLLFVFFSVTILQIIGVDILQIPGLRR